MIFFGIVLLTVMFVCGGCLLRDRYHERIVRFEGEWLSTMQRGLAHEFVFLEPKKLKAWARYALYAGLCLSLLLLSPLPISVGFIFFWFGPGTILRVIKNRRKAKFEKQFARVLPQIASILRAGHSFERAIESLSRTEPNPLAQEFGLVLKELRLGTTLDDALLALLGRFPNRDLEILIRATSISRRVGTNLAEAFSTVAEMIRTRHRLKDKLSALTAQGRTQAWVAILIPIGILFVLERIDPEFLTPLFVTGIGRIILVVCVAMLTTGGIWILRISRMELIR